LKSAPVNRNGRQDVFYENESKQDISLVKRYGQLWTLHRKQSETKLWFLLKVTWSLFQVFPL